MIWEVSAPFQTRKYALLITHKFKASGRVVRFEGFLKVYAEKGEEKDNKSDDEKLQLLPHEELGELVTKTQEIPLDDLAKNHPWVIDYALTGRMETLLDLNVEKQETWQRFCKVIRSISTQLEQHDKHEALQVCHETGPSAFISRSDNLFRPLPSIWH